MMDANKTQGDRMIRLVQVLTFIPAFGLLLPAGITSRNALYPLLLIPQGFSMLHGISRQYSQPKNSGLNCFIDWALGIYFIGMLIPCWIVGANSWRINAMLVSYGTVPAMVNFCIHATFALRPVFTHPNSFLSGWFTCSTCPHCQRDLPSKLDPRLLWDLPGSSGSSAHSHKTKDGYVSVSADVPEANADGEAEETPRESLEDESTGLIRPTDKDSSLV